jgi:endonuclease/exonuclease/phosphatase (EEP) superfamily protein YafD
MGVRHGVTGVLALILTAVALPPLLARLIGGNAPRPGPQLAALAPAATVPATAAVIVAAFSALWLALLLAIPAAILLAWQLPPRQNARAVNPVAQRAAAWGRDSMTIRVLTLNSRGGSADPGALLAVLRQHQVDVLAIQELTWDMVHRLDEAGLASVLPHAHLDPRPAAPGAGLWARWPLDPLPPVPGMTDAAPRARVEPLPGRPVVLTVVHPLTPMRQNAYPWQRDLTRLRPLAETEGPQIVAGDFNATRDHQAFRDLLAAGFADCADIAQHRTWPGFTWPTSWDLDSDRKRQRSPDRRALPIMRLDHVLVAPAGTAVREARPIWIPGTDHLTVLAVIEFTQPSQR